MLKPKWILYIGDVLAILIVTVIGFVTHNEADLAFLARMLAAFVPLIIAWFLLAPLSRLFQKEITSNPKQLWRPPFVMLFSGSLAVVLRGLILNAPIIPIFAVVFSATSAFGILVWRGVYFFLNRTSKV
ncbi:MAG TPA: DUF3054 domain-containing protein [Anaerolineales bacterium]|nr:DUF3054 domain-containing protein [Anaerolineales bacterium]